MGSAGKRVQGIIFDIDGTLVDSNDAHARAWQEAGDTPYDVLAAHRAATPIAAVLSGGFEREELKKAEFLFQDVHSLVKGIEPLDDDFNR